MYERWDKGGLPLEMASRKTYPCFACEKAGHDNVMVYLDGKDEQGRTKYLNEDGTRRTHQGSSATQQTQQQQQSQQEQPKTEYEKSVEKGIGAFSMMTDLIRLVEQNQKLLVTLTEKVEHLTKLVYAQSQHPQQQHD